VTGTLNNRSVSDILPTYTKYIALITQSGTNDPTVVELENTIGPIIWTRISTGVYEGTLTGVFTLDKVYTTLNQVYTNSIALVYRTTAIDVIKIDYYQPTQPYCSTSRYTS
jgi:hypothetical protein